MTDPTQKPPAYRPMEHWSALHAEESLRAVGQSGYPTTFNAWLYHIGRRNVRAFLARHGLDALEGWRVFDAGVGTGYWMGLWLELGASAVDGCDLVPAAVDRLRARFPESRLIAGDLSDPASIPAFGSYDLVSAMNVLLHIVDESRFDAAAANLALAVAPGGWLLLAEPALARETLNRVPTASASSIARPIRRYVEALAPMLALVAVGPSTVVGANPIEVRDPRYRLYDLLWHAAGGAARRGPRWAAASGRGLAALDRLAMLTGAAPSGKLLLFRRNL